LGPRNVFWARISVGNLPLRREELKKAIKEGNLEIWKERAFGKKLKG